MRRRRRVKRRRRENEKVALRAPGATSGCKAPPPTVLVLGSVTILTAGNGANGDLPSL